MQRKPPRASVQWGTSDKLNHFSSARGWLFAPKVKVHAYVCVGVNRVLSGSPHLLGEDIVGHVHHAVLMVTEAFYFGHHRGLDAGVDHLISFLVDEDPTAGQRKKNPTQKI